MSGYPQGGMTPPYSMARSTLQSTVCFDAAPESLADGLGHGGALDAVQQRPVATQRSLGDREQAFLVGAGQALLDQLPRAGGMLLVQRLVQAEVGRGRPIVEAVVAEQALQLGA